MRPKLTTAAALLIALLPASMALAKLPANFQILLVTENVPPLAMTKRGSNFGRDADIKGISADIVRELFKRSEINYQLSMRYPLTRITSMVKTTPNSAIFPLAFSQGRSPYFKWVGPLVDTPQELISKGNNHFVINQLKDAAQYRIGAHQGSGAAEILEENGIPYIDSVGNDDNIDKLITGQVDLCVISDLALRYLANKKGLRDLTVVKVLQNQSFFLALNRDTPDEVVARLQRSLDSMRQDGTLDTIINTYVKEDLAPPPLP